LSAPEIEKVDQHHTGASFARKDILLGSGARLELIATGWENWG